MILTERVPRLVTESRMVREKNYGLDVAGAALLVAMVIIERRARNPLIPPSFFANRTRSVVNLVTLLFMAAFISYNFMLSLFEQQVLGYSPLVSGLAWLPMAVAIGPASAWAPP
jgi:ABC-type Fe3+-siderophore transport system permease subunit